MSKIEQVKVGAHHYRIEYKELLYDRDTHDDYVGQCDHNALQMSLRTERAPSLMAETFLHESVHAISNDRNLDLSERQVDQVAAGLLALIVDNPAVFGETFLQQWTADHE